MLKLSIVTRVGALALAVAAVSGCLAEGQSDDLGGDELGGDEDELFGLGSECPTAKEDRGLSRWLWRTTRYPERFVWTPDGQRLLATETMYEEKISWDPLRGSTAQRRRCQRLYWVNLDGSGRQDLTETAPGQLGEVFAFPAASYVVAQYWLGGETGGVEYRRVGLDGKSRALARFAATCEWGRVIPSPDGQRMAIVTTVQPDCGEKKEGQDVPTASTVTVKFLDANGAAIAGEAKLDFKYFARSTWTPSGALVVSDLESAVRVNADYSLSSAAVPRCMDPATSSSEIDAQGRIVGVSEKELPEIVVTEPGTGFGCQ